MSEPRKIDWTREYGEVFGAPARMFEQDGLMFTAAGVAVNYVPEVEEPRETGPVPDDDTLNDMDGNELRALVEMFDGRWTTKEAAKKFIRGQRE